MGRHVAPNSDQQGWGTGPVPHGRRRTDGAAPVFAGAATDLSDHPTTPRRSRAERRRDGLLAAGEDPGRRRPLPPRPVPAGTAWPATTAGRPDAVSPPPPGGRRAADAQRAGADGLRRRGDQPAPLTRPRLPVPPAVTPPPAPPAAPRTTVAPFQAVPSPVLDEPEPSTPAPGSGADLGELRRDAGRSTGGTPSAADRTAGPADGAYRDWTRPSDSRNEVPPAPPATELIPDRTPSRSSGADAAVRPAPATEVIPDRAPAGARAAAVDDLDDDALDDDGFDDLDDDGLDDDGLDHDGLDHDGLDHDGLDHEVDDLEDDAGPRRVPGPVTGPSTGVTGNRAASRAERQAAEAERRRAARRSGQRPAGRDHEDGQPRLRRAAIGLLAVAVVALVVLGVYSFSSPDAQVVSASRAGGAAPSTSAPSVAPSATLPPLQVQPLPPADAAPATPVRVPVTVLNATGITGLAADISGALGAGGWQPAGIGQYEGGDVAATTVYFTDGDETQRQAAVQLREQFPALQGPAPRFFEVPGVPDPGLVVVAAGEWRP